MYEGSPRCTMHKDAAIRTFSPRSSSEELEKCNPPLYTTQPGLGGALAYSPNMHLITDRVDRVMHMHRQRTGNSFGGVNIHFTASHLFLFHQLHLLTSHSSDPSRFSSEAEHSQLQWRSPKPPGLPMEAHPCQHNPKWHSPIPRLTTQTSPMKPSTRKEISLRATQLWMIIPKKARGRS